MWMIDDSGLILRTDSQLDGKMLVDMLMSDCQRLGVKWLAGSGMQDLILNKEGLVKGVMTDNARMVAKLGIVIAAGTWTGALLNKLPGQTFDWEAQFAPRKGYLLVAKSPPGMPPLRHGLMESAYTKHYAPNSKEADGGPQITFTATTGVSGCLLIGSSRDTHNWDPAVEEDVLTAILDRAALYLPSLRAIKVADTEVRVGFRPFSQSGLPVIGPVPGCPGVFVAAGHEGSGLTFGPATGDIVSAWILDGWPHQQWALQFSPHVLFQ
eukprot:jgi/Botrbrau1/4974/Bobra.0396s0004.1